MSSYNKVILMGNLVRDPELRYSQKGTALGKFTIATTRKWNSESGEKKEETAFIDVDCFGRQAETVGQYFRKGSPILLEGRLKLDQWDDKATGQKRSKLGVVLESFSFVGSKQESASPPSYPAPTPAPAQPSESDDVPF